MKKKSKSNELKIIPYDIKLSENVANLVLDIIHKHYPKLSLKVKVKEDIIKLVDRKIVLYKDYEEDVLKSRDQTLNRVTKKIDEEIAIVKLFCLGLVHPDQANQKKFTKWLQGTVVFHLNDLKRRVK